VAFIRDALVICLTVILVRVVWVFTATYLPLMVSARWRRMNPDPGWRSVLLVAWAGWLVIGRSPGAAADDYCRGGLSGA
jgi:hypothetical protein